MAGISRSRSKSSARSYKSNRGGAQTDRRMDEPRDEMKPGDREPSPQKNGLKTSRSRSRSRSRGGRYSRSRSRGRSDSRRSYSRGRGGRGRSRSRGRRSYSRGRGRGGYGGGYGGRRSYSRGRGRSFPRRRQPPVCKDFLRGDCTYGNRCKFLHDEKARENRGYYGDRERRDSGSYGGSYGGGRGGSETCRDFQRGKCSYGSRCRFRH